MSKRTLYEIGEDLQTLNDLLFDLGGDITDPQVESEIERLFAGLNEERDRKINGYCGFIKRLEAQAELQEAEYKRLLAMQRATLHQVKRLKERLKLFLENQQQPKLDTGIFKLAIQANGGEAPFFVPAQWSADPASAPEQFHRKKIELDKDAARKLHEEFWQRAEQAIAAAQAFSDEERQTALDAWMFANPDARRDYEAIKDCQMGERGTHLRIR